MKDTRLFKRLFAYMKPYLLRYVVAIVFMIIIVGIDVISPLLISESLDELGKEVMLRFAEELSDISIIESQPKLEGRTMIMLLAPKK